MLFLFLDYRNKLYLSSHHRQNLLNQEGASIDMLNSILPCYNSRYLLLTVTCLLCDPKSVERMARAQLGWISSADFKIHNRYLKPHHHVFYNVSMMSYKSRAQAIRHEKIQYYTASWTLQLLFYKIHVVTQSLPQTTRRSCQHGTRQYWTRRRSPSSRMAFSHSCSGLGAKTVQLSMDH